MSLFFVVISLRYLPAMSACTTFLFLFFLVILLPTTSCYLAGRSSTVDDDDDGGGGRSIHCLQVTRKGNSELCLQTSSVTTIILGFTTLCASAVAGHVSLSAR